ncbi:MAG: GNAT family N-acetyltransferase [Dehalococcoidia bacterium]
MTTKNIRAAVRKDAHTIVQMIRSLALYEKESLETVKITESDVLRDGFGETARFETLLAELDGTVVGFALFFFTYSTWTGKPGLYLEDLYVEKDARGYGLGRDLMKELARIANNRGCSRFELSVLNWNPTREFYHRLGFKDMNEWLKYRLTEPSIEKLAQS